MGGHSSHEQVWEGDSSHDPVFLIWGGDSSYDPYFGQKLPGQRSEEVKLSLFKTYFYICCSLCANYRLQSYKMVKVVHNDAFRSLLNMPRYTSASTLFVLKNMDNLDVMMRTKYFFPGKKE